MQNKSNIKQKKLSQVYLHGFTHVNIRGIGIITIPIRPKRENHGDWIHILIAPENIPIEPNSFAIGERGYFLTSFAY